MIVMLQEVSEKFIFSNTCYFVRNLPKQRILLKCVEFVVSMGKVTNI